MFRFIIGCIFCLLSGLSFAIDGFYVGGGMALNQTTADNIYKTYPVLNSTLATGSYLGNQVRDSV